MVYSGYVIDHFDETGQKMVFHQTAQDTNGSILKIETWLKPGAFQPGEHIHPFQEERIEIISGQLGWKHRGQSHTLTAGDTVIAPAREPHDFWVIGTEPAHFFFEFRPALNFDIFLEVAIGREKGRKNLLQYAVLLQEMDSVFMPAATPSGIAVALILTLLAPIGRVMGYRTHYY